MALAVLIALSALFACTREEPVYIGYASVLSGRGAELGYAGRNGAQLAVNDFNARGGVDGRRVELVVRDNRGDRERAAAVTRELVDFGCVAIIGHLLSEMSVAALPVVQESDVVMVSPATATTAVSARDDQFLRIYPDVQRMAERLARHVHDERGLRRIALLGDRDNGAFTETWFGSFADALRDAGGTIVEQAYFHGSGSESFSALSEKLLAVQPDGVLIIANAPDTGMLCQQLRKHGSDLPVFTSEWAFAGDLLRYGGQAVEGLTLFLVFDPEASGFDYQRFVAAYRDIFNETPGFAAVNAYDATRLTLTALQQQQEHEPLKQALLRQGTYRGLQTSMRLDRFGDIERPLFLTRIVDGSFRKVGAP